MKFLLNIIQISSSPSPSWACPCGARDIPGSFHRLSFRYSMHRSRPPKSDAPNTSCQAQETPFGEAERYGLSTSSPNYLYSGTADIQHAYECGPCSQRPSEYAHSPNHISVPTDHGSDVEGRPSKHYSDILSPRLYDNLNYLLNVSSSDIRPSNKTKIFIETKVAAMKLQGFNH